MVFYSSWWLKKIYYRLFSCVLDYFFLERRLRELALHTKLVAVPGVIRSTALIVPSRIVEQESGREAPATARVTEEVERRAVEAVLAAERAIGRNPVEMPRNNPGYDICSTDDIEDRKSVV